ncbi:CDP-alcohol phosphatidyltransferase family protein [Jatrophihabitans endophyticus]|uniref:CDP-alcohol phosphatidyltransferase family protein n=1 Tax=Jatrophihabitans endophyticus TaxID=1206085 RepID=UPI0019F583CE|nr:CDP-alcohol phosphatidyltransferase family protein [Jatrophihabitans endophyticus]MBE7188107.1 CDP-alcohol phosphatidyltransferase family protein [Jatrophihabitans endophyticus]
MTPPRAELERRWSALHHDIDPDAVPLLGPWLRLVWAGGWALDRAGVPPNAVTVAGVAAAAGAVALAGAHPAAAGAAVVAAALCDGLDGATAVVGDRATRSGAVLDAVADRLGDGAFAAVLWRRGAPPRLAAAAAGTAWAVDGLRRARRTPDRITAAERPTFTICALAACAAGSFTRRRWPATVSAAVWLGAGAVAFVQLGSARPSDP